MARLHRSYLNTRGNFVHSLLERLRQRLRDLGQPLRDAPPAEPARQSSRADVGEATARRTELEPAGSRLAAAQDANRLPQQPQAPASTRLKAAVLSKRRGPIPRRATGPTWGQISFLDFGDHANLNIRGVDTPAAPINAHPLPPESASDPHNLLWTTRQELAVGPCFSSSMDGSSPLPWHPEPPLWSMDATGTRSGPFCGSASLKGAAMVVPDPNPGTTPIDDMRPASDLRDAFLCPRRSWGEDLSAAATDHDTW
jgi:hypothetical protein